MKRGFPTAGLLSVVLVLAFDRLALSPQGPWEWIGARLGGEPLETGVVADRLELRRAESFDGRPLVVIAGSSRVQAGVEPGLLAAGELPEANFLRLAHPGITPLILRTMTDTILAREPALVVLLVSEFDTHHPLLLVPKASFGGLGAVVDLVRATGPAFAFERRTDVLRFTLAGLLASYRYRSVLDAAFGERWTDFSAYDPRYVAAIQPTWFGGNPQFDREWQSALMRLAPAERDAFFEGLEAARVADEAFGSEAPGPYDRPDWSRAEAPFLIDEDFERAMVALDGELGSRMPYTIYAHLRDLALADYARVQKALVARTVETLVAGGTRVLLVDGPVHPGAAAFFDPAVRADFLAFARELARDAQVELLESEELETFAKWQFKDLSHLNRSGARQLTGAILGRVAELLER